MNFKSVFAFFIISIFYIFSAKAQYNGYSPYSKSALGDLTDRTFSYQNSMASTGTAVDNYYNINLLNPASYGSLKLTTYEVGANLKFTRFYEGTTPDSIKNKAVIASFNFMALGFRLGKRGGLAFGLTPYSSSGYVFNTKSEIAGLGTVNYNYRGNGGISNAFIGMGYKVYRDSAKFISVGANANFLFGTITDEQRVIFDNSSKSYYNTLRTNELQVKGFTFDYGLLYQHRINRKYTIGFGATYIMTADLNATQNTIGWRYTTNSALEESYRDTILLSNITGKITLPSGFGIGLYFGKRDSTNLSYNSNNNNEVAKLNKDKIVGDNLRLALDYKIQNWQDFKLLGINNGLKRNERYSLGISYWPAKKMTNNDSKIKRFFNAAQYRAGAYYNVSHLFLNQTQITDYGVSVGLGLPVIRAFSSINVSANFGIRGTTQNNLIKENYARILFNFTLNDVWFIKRRVD